MSLGRFLAVGAASARFRIGGVLVSVHAATRSVNDEHAHIARFGDDIIHPRRDLLNPIDRPFAVVQVPHVANDDGGLRRIPVLRPLPNLLYLGIEIRRNAIPQDQ
jgi:hypothetical protein